MFVPIVTFDLQSSHLFIRQAFVHTELGESMPGWYLFVYSFNYKYNIQLWSFGYI